MIHYACADCYLLLLHMLRVSWVRYPAGYRAQPDTGYPAGYPAKHIRYPAGYRISKNGRISCTSLQKRAGHVSKNGRRFFHVKCGKGREVEVVEAVKVEAIGYEQQQGWISSRDDKSRREKRVLKSYSKHFAWFKKGLNLFLCKGCRLILRIGRRLFPFLKVHRRF